MTLLLISSRKVQTSKLEIEKHKSLNEIIYVWWTIISTLSELFSNFRLIQEIFKDHPGQSGDAGADAGGKKRKGGGKTVSSFYKEQLSHLMTTLHATEPHFIR